MDTNPRTVSAVVIAISVGILIVAIVFLSPFKNVSWGRVETTLTQTVTVSGEAKTQTKNQIARFTAGINAVNDNKDQAVAEVNQKMEALIYAVKKFGILQEDIKTQNASVYQSEETYYDNGVTKSRPGQWRVSNTIEIKIRDVTRTTDLSNLLSSSGANNIYGPDFSIDDTDTASKELLQKAIENAKEKAQIMVASSGRSLGEVLSVSEGSSQPSYAIPYGAGGGGGGAPLEPGSQTISKTVTVTFELK